MTITKFKCSIEKGGAVGSGIASWINSSVQYNHETSLTTNSSDVNGREKRLPGISETLLSGAGTEKVSEEDYRGDKLS